MKYSLLLIILLLSNALMASHEGLGFEISSKFLSASNQHVIIVKHYRDSLYPANSSLILNTFSTCGNSNSSILYSYSDTLKTNCSVERILVHHYFDTLTLPSSCRNYSFDVNICCIQGSISRSGALFTELRFTNDSLANNSPVFNRNQFIYASINDTSVFDFSAYDSNGDSLSYELYRNSQFSSYWPGFNRLNPFGQNAYTQLNASTGALTFKPNNSGKYFITIKVNEYRNGNLIGFVTKDIACFVSTSSLNRTITWSNIAVAQNVCVGDSIHLNGTISGPLTSSLSVGMYYDSSISSIQNNGKSVNFNWIVQSSDIGLKTFNLFIEDGNCQVRSIQLFANVINCQTTFLPELIIPKIEVYPNPSTSFITIRSDTEIQRINLFDISGKQIELENQTIGDNLINLEGLRTGVYVLKVRTQNREVVKKINVIH